VSASAEATAGSTGWMKHTKKSQKPEYRKKLYAWLAICRKNVPKLLRTPHGFVGGRTLAEKATGCAG
jgi:hypothetical protein